MVVMKKGKKVNIKEGLGNGTLFKCFTNIGWMYIE